MTHNGQGFAQVAKSVILLLASEKEGGHHPGRADVIP